MEGLIYILVFLNPDPCESYLVFLHGEASGVLIANWKESEILKKVIN